MHLFTRSKISTKKRKRRKNDSRSKLNLTVNIFHRQPAELCAARDARDDALPDPSSMHFNCSHSLALGEKIVWNMDDVGGERRSLGRRLLKGRSISGALRVSSYDRQQSWNFIKLKTFTFLEGFQNRVNKIWNWSSGWMVHCEENSQYPPANLILTQAQEKTLFNHLRKRSIEKRFFNLIFHSGHQSDPVIVAQRKWDLFIAQFFLQCSVNWIEGWKERLDWKQFLLYCYCWGHHRHASPSTRERIRCGQISFVVSLLGSKRRFTKDCNMKNGVVGVVFRCLDGKRI